MAAYNNPNRSLFQAVLQNNAAEVENLISLGADVKNPKISLKTFLHDAAFFNDGDSHFDLFKVLLMNGVNVNSQTTTSNIAPLHYLVRRADVKTVQLLLDFGANVNLKDSDGEISLFKVFDSDKLDVVKLLVKHGSDVNSTNKCKSTPFYVACAKSNFEIYKFLKNVGANFEALDFKNRTPLMNMLMHPESKDYKLKLESLLKYSDVNVIDSNGYNILRFEQSKVFWKNILGHVAKLKILDLTVHQSILDTISSNQEYKDYFKSLTEELTLAKNTKLPDSWITFLNLLVDSRRKLRNYGGNQGLLDLRKPNYTKKFPVYGILMWSRARKGIKTRRLFDKSSLILSDILPILNPNHLIIRDVLDCLTLKDYNLFVSKNKKRSRVVNN